MSYLELLFEVNVGAFESSVVDGYIPVCGSTAFPTNDQSYEAEKTLISNELNGTYRHVYDELFKYRGSAKAAYEAGCSL